MVWIKDKEREQTGWSHHIVLNVLLKDILTFKLPEKKKKMDFVLCGIQKVSLPHQTRLSQVSCGISWLMMISSLKLVISHLLKILESLKRQWSPKPPVSPAIIFMLEAAHIWIYLSVL